ncbi:MAG: type II toxin-antitoxin system VapC family toxin [Limisphaerales bacterium]
MIERFVVDASVAVAWVHPAQATAKTHVLLRSIESGAMAEAPALWPLEVANALLVLVRRGKLKDSERTIALNFLNGLSVKLDYEMATHAFTVVSKLAADHSLSVYDATYLELCLRKKLPLGCKDGPLREAAEKCGVKVL